MPWTCPSCRHPIRHDAEERSPRPGVVYRCHICRIDLVVDAKRTNLTVVLPGEHDDE